jgi:hypothetical protein
MKIIEALQEIILQKYLPNKAVSSGTNDKKQETFMVSIFEKHGLKQHELTEDEKKSLRKFLDKNKKIILEEWLTGKDYRENIPSELKNIENGTYIYQPFGTQNSPDFIIIENGLFIPIEAKSSKKGYPQYNSGGIKVIYIYVLTSRQHDETTVYLGSDIITNEINELITEHIERCRELDKILNEKLEEKDIHKRGIRYYTRPMIIHKGSSEYTNYFKHENRIETEENVFRLLRKLSKIE